MTGPKRPPPAHGRADSRTLTVRMNPETMAELISSVRQAEPPGPYVPDTTVVEPPAPERMTTVALSLPLSRDEALALRTFIAGYMERDAAGWSSTGLGGRVQEVLRRLSVLVGP